MFKMNSLIEEEIDKKLKNLNIEVNIDFFVSDTRFLVKTKLFFTKNSYFLKRWLKNMN
jgi:hypothetical protein